MTDTTAQFFAALVALSILIAIIDEERFFSTLAAIRGNRATGAEPKPQHPSHFKLVRYFTIVCLAMIGLVALCVTYFQNEQEALFESAQRARLGSAQAEQDARAARLEEEARQRLLNEREAGHADLARVLTNGLWAREVAPLLSQAEALSVGACEAQDTECILAARQRIVRWKRFGSLEGRLAELLQGSSLKRLRIVDRRGVTIYSTERSSVAELQSGSVAWKAALEGTTSSRLQRRAGAAFPEGGGNGRHLISTHLPVVLPGSDQAVAVLELTSDVTDALAQIGNDSLLQPTAIVSPAGTAAADEERMRAASLTMRVLVVALMLVFFVGLYALVRRADRLGRQQEQDFDATRKKLAATEKMAATNHLDTDTASRVNTALAHARQSVQRIQSSMQNVASALVVAGALARAIKRAEGDQVVLNIAQARQRLAASDPAEVDVAALQQALASALAEIDRVSSLLAAQIPSCPLEHTEPATAAR